MRRVHCKASQYAHRSHATTQADVEMRLPIFFTISTMKLERQTKGRSEVANEAVASIFWTVSERYRN